MEYTGFLPFHDDLKIGVLIIGKHTRTISFANEDAADLWKIDAAELAGKKCRGILCTSDEPCILDGGEWSRTCFRKDRLERPDGKRLRILKSIQSMKYNGEDSLLVAFTGYREGFWDYNAISRRLTFDWHLYAMTGHRDSDFPADFDRWLELVHEDDRDETSEQLFRFIEGRAGSYEKEFKFLHKNGRYIWIRARGMVVEKETDGTPVRFLGIHQLITGEKEREKRRILLTTLQGKILEQGDFDEKAELIVKTIVASTQSEVAELMLNGDADLCRSGCPYVDTDRYRSTCETRRSCLHLVARAGLEPADEWGNRRIPYPAPGSPSIPPAEKYGLTDSAGMRTGFILVQRRDKSGSEISGYMESIAAVASQAVCNYRTERELQIALHEAERANNLMNGREIRLRQLKSEVNSLLSRLGLDMKYNFTENTGPGVPVSEDDIKNNALSLAEDAELARRELMESNDQLSLIKQAVNSSSDAIAISTINGDFYYINRTFSELFGYTIDELARLMWDDLFTSRENSVLSLEKARSGQSFGIETLMTGKTGLEIPVYMRSVPFMVDRNNYGGIIWNFTDITARRESERKIRRDMEMQREMLRKANLLQQSYIQKTIPMTSNFNIQGLFMPCEKLGGDFFKILKGISRDKLIIIIGDCTDHGLKASLDASLLSSVIDPHIKGLFEDNRTDLFLNRVSRTFMKLADEDQYPTMLAMIIDIGRKTLVYSNANSELPYLFRKGELSLLDKVSGMHIGYLDDPVYELKEIPLEDGDRLILYSDSVTEMNSGEGKRHNRSDFDSIVRKCKGSSTRSFYSLVRELEEISGGFPLEDDTTLIQIDYLDGERFSCEVYSMEQWDRELGRIKEALSRFDYSFDEREKAAIAVTELVINGLVHGNRGDLSKKVTIEGTLDCAEAKLTVTDEGEGFDRTSVEDPVEQLLRIMERDVESEYTHGRGLVIAEKMFSSVEWNDKGNSVDVTMKKQIREIITIDKISF